MMRHWNKTLSGWGIIAALCLAALPAHAQEQTPETPKPAARAYPPIGDNGDQTSPDTLEPDTRPLTGIQSPTLGRIESPHSYWVPGFQYANTIQNDSSTSSGWSTTNYIAANVSLLDSTRSSQLALNYSGGGSFSNNPAIGNGTFQELGASETFQWNRWRLQFFDQFSYLPESNFGFGVGTPLGSGGVPIAQPPPQPGLGQSAQSLFTAVGPQYNNSFATQVFYNLSPRGSVNVSGSYGILRFVDAGSIDSNNAGASVGYNYALTKEDTIGLVDRFGRYSYVGNPQVIEDNAINVAYGRKITGRLALQIFGGPDIVRYKVAIAGSTGEVTGSGGGTLTYGFERGTVAMSYNHGVTGGSGVFVGAETDQVTGSVTRQVSRAWQLQGSVGYALNRTLASLALPVNQTIPSYNSVYVAGTATRPWGPNMVLSLSYRAAIQTNGGANYTQHQILISFQWHTRPLVLR
jgi:hypothetical protein